MTYNSITYQVMIASPSDVLKERDIIRNIIYEWNTINSYSKKSVLLPVGWETHSTPTMGSSPQKIINKTLLKNSDLLVGVFWTRIGTSTEKYISGTVEEIEEHIKTGKPTMLYFSNMPVHPDSVVPDQYEELKKFKKSCESRGIYETYSDIEEFKTKFNRQLQIKLNTDSYFKIDIDYDFSTVYEKQIKLSDEAKKILIEARKPNASYILRLETSDGLQIKVGKTSFVEGRDPRIEATWESAIEELERRHLIKDNGYKREVFSVTKDGYDLSDEIM